MTRRDALGLFGFLLASLAVSGIGGAVVATSVATWYPTLVKPAFNPPAWVFGPVWTVLYVLMAVAAWRVWRKRGAGRTPSALPLYFIQLGFNLVWTVLFFGLRSPGWALAEGIVLVALVFATTIAFARRDRWAGWLFAPYLGWVAFAMILNAAIWRLNP